MTLFYFATDQVRVSLICVNFCGSYVPFGMWNTGNTVFCTYLLCAFTFWAEILHMTLFNVLKIMFKCHDSVSVWLFVCPSIFCTFLLHALTYLAENLNLTFTWFLECISFRKVLYKNSFLKCSWRAYYAPFVVLRYIFSSVGIRSFFAMMDLIFSCVVSNIFIAT